MKTINRKPWQFPQLILLALFLFALVLVIVFPSARQVSAVEPTSERIFLSQIRSFFFIPLCLSSGIGLFVSYAASRPRLSPQLRRVCLLCGLVMLGIGIYICYTLAMFQYPVPLSPATSIYMADNRWIICAWWSIAVILLTLSAPRNTETPRGVTPK